LPGIRRAALREEFIRANVDGTRNVDITFMNPGGLRADIAAGEVSYAQAAAVQPFANTLVSMNLTGGVFVNQSAAFSDFHGTGANPAATGAFTDGAFVSGRFTIVQSRRHASE
jgi:2',3'-cyclic-nucleotide 2'-phosphodiesterase (5'-nucleotidase family)